MQGYREVVEQAEMDGLLAQFQWFHDSIVSAMRVANRGWVRADGHLVMSLSFDLQVVLQSQFAPHAIELVFVGVKSLMVGSADPFTGATGSASSTGIRMAFDSRMVVKATRVFFRQRPDWVGPLNHLHGEVPSPDAIPATPIADNWRQCSGCADAWLVSPECVFSRCPTCHCLTELAASERHPSADA